MKEKLTSIYNFLLNNRQYNKELQEKYYVIMALALIGDWLRTTRVPGKNSSSFAKSEYAAQ
jgi:hypothetical protein